MSNQLLIVVGFGAGILAAGLIEYLLEKLLPKTPSWRHLIAIVVAALVFSWIAIVPILYTQPRVKITSHFDRGTVVFTEDFNGVFSDLSEDSELWLYIYDQERSLYYFNSVTMFNDGTWESRGVLIGDPAEGEGRPFEIGILILNASDSARIREQLGGATSIPDEATVSQKITVYRAATPRQSIIFLVSANKGWQDTGIKVSENDTVSIEYLSGLWDWSKDYPDFDADGDPNTLNKCENVCNQVGLGEQPAGLNCPLPGEQIGALVGKIGGNESFLVGNNAVYTIPENIGKQRALFLTTNDCFSGLGDNEGSIQVAITVSE